MKLKDKIAFITGGGAGIGKAIAEEFIAAGAYVILGDIDGDLVKNTAEDLGERATGETLDVRDLAQIQDVVQRAVDHHKRLDILVNNAGIVRKGWCVDLPEDVWDEVLDVNLKGTFLCSKAVLPMMIKQEYGRIINISSIAGKLGQATDTPYCASKFGQIGFTQALALEVAQYNILVNAICPGPITTALGIGGFEQAAALRGLERDQFVESVVARTPQGRLGVLEEVAKMALFLGSEDCSFTTGSAFNISGGLVMH